MIMLFIILLGIIGSIAIIACIIAIVVTHIADTHANGQGDQESQDKKTGR